jgi:hypothetical protein
MWTEWHKDTEKGYERGHQIAKALLVNIDLPFIHPARACIILGCTPAVFWASVGICTVERGMWAMRGDGKEPNAAELKLLADCWGVLERAEAAQAETAEEEEDQGDDDEEGDEDDDEEDGEEDGEEDEEAEGSGVRTPEDEWSDAVSIQRGERVSASPGPAPAIVSTADRLASQEANPAAAVRTSSVSGTASADVPSLQQRLRGLRGQVLREGYLGVRFIDDKLLCDAQRLADEGKEEEGEEACDRFVAYMEECE